MEDAMESLRYFAEECDYLASINVFTDIDDGFGGLSCSLLEEIRNDFGKAVCVPVWGLSNHGSSSGQHPGMKEQLQQLGVPVLYSLYPEYASVFIPMCVPAVTTVSPFITVPTKTGAYVTSALCASVIETATSYVDFDGRPSLRWTSAATAGGRFPVCLAECMLPCVHPLAMGYESLLENFPESRSLTHREERGADSGCDRFSATLNPFSSSVSCAKSGRWAALRQRRGRAFSNVISVRGPCGLGRTCCFPMLTTWLSRVNFLV